MRLRLDTRQAAAEASRARLARLPVCRLVVVFAASALAGCDAVVPLPETALLRPQPPPKCESRPAATDEGGDTAKLRKLDYEVQCYRHAEMIARNRLGRLQDSIHEAARAQKAAARASGFNNP